MLLHYVCKIQRQVVTQRFFLMLCHFSALRIGHFQAALTFLAHAAYSSTYSIGAPLSWQKFETETCRNINIQKVLCNKTVLNFTYVNWYQFIPCYIFRLLCKVIR